MSDEMNRVGLYSRRDLGKLALAALPMAGLLGRSKTAFAWQAKPNSVWGGVPFGIFAPYRFGPEASDLEGTLKALVGFGVSQTELSNSVVENYLGAPQPAARGGGANAAGRAGAAPVAGRAAQPATSPAPGAIACVGGVPVPGGAAAAMAAGGRGRAAQTPEQQAAARAQTDALLKWRTSVPMSKFAEVRTKFANAGVTIYAFRLTLTNEMPDAEYDYTFNAAKALGATQITMEHPSDPAQLEAHRRLRGEARRQRRLPPAHDRDDQRVGRRDGAVAA